MIASQAISNFFQTPGPGRQAQTHSLGRATHRDAARQSDGCVDPSVPGGYTKIIYVPASLFPHVPKQQHIITYIIYYIRIYIYIIIYIYIYICVCMCVCVCVTTYLYYNILRDVAGWNILGDRSPITSREEPLLSSSGPNSILFGALPPFSGASSNWKVHKMTSGKLASRRDFLGNRSNMVQQSPPQNGCPSMP